MRKNYAISNFFHIEGDEMQCPKCFGDDVAVVYQEIGSRTARHGTGFGGKFNNAARKATAVTTLGISNIVWKKSEGTQKTKNKTRKVALCQSCGHDWNIK